MELKPPTAQFRWIFKKYINRLTPLTLLICKVYTDSSSRLFHIIDTYYWITPKMHFAIMTDTIYVALDRFWVGGVFWEPARPPPPPTQNTQKACLSLWFMHIRPSCYGMSEMGGAKRCFFLWWARYIFAKFGCVAIAKNLFHALIFHMWKFTGNSLFCWQMPYCVCKVKLYFLHYTNSICNRFLQLSVHPKS